MSDEEAEPLLKAGAIEEINQPFTGQIKPPPKLSSASTPFREKFNQLHAIAGDMKTEIHRLDGTIEERGQALQAIYAAKVTRADFLQYLKDDLRQRGEQFVQDLKSEFHAGRIPDLYFQFRNQEGRREAGATIAMKCLAGSAKNVDVMTEAGFFFYFGDLIAERFCDALDATGKVKFGETTIPISERRAQCKKLETEIAKLQFQRDAMTADMIEAGLV